MHMSHMSHHICFYTFTTEVNSLCLLVNHDSSTQLLAIQMGSKIGLYHLLMGHVHPFPIPSIAILSHGGFQSMGVLIYHPFK